MSSQPHIRGGGKAIGALIKDLPRIHGKSRVLAGIIGFAFGGLGLGLYFWSWRDFLYPILVFILAVLVAGTFILPVLGVAPGWLVGSLFASGWGIWRASGGGS